MFHDFVLHQQSAGITPPVGFCSPRPLTAALLVCDGQEELSHICTTGRSRHTFTAWKQHNTKTLNNTLLLGGGGGGPWRPILRDEHARHL